MPILIFQSVALTFKVTEQFYNLTIDDSVTYGIVQCYKVNISVILTSISIIHGVRASNPANRTLISRSRRINTLMLKIEQCYITYCRKAL